MNNDSFGDQRFESTIARVRHTAKLLDQASADYLEQQKSTQVPISTFCTRYPESIRCQLLSRLRLEAYFAANDAQQPSASYAWPQEGADFQGFLIRGELGRGGMGRVYLAWDRKLERHVALKVAPVNKREAIALAQLVGHPNVITVHSVVEDQQSGLTGLCMPFVGQATLAHFLSLAREYEHPPQPVHILEDLAFYAPWQNFRDKPAIEVSESYTQQLFAWTHELATGLKFAHSRGFLHLDVKPSNVLRLPGAERC